MPKKKNAVAGMGKTPVPNFGKPKVGVMNHYMCWQYYNFGWFRFEYGFVDKLVVAYSYYNIRLNAPLSHAIRPKIDSAIDKFL